MMVNSLAKISSGHIFISAPIGEHPKIKIFAPLAVKGIADSKALGDPVQSMITSIPICSAWARLFGMIPPNCPGATILSENWKTFVLRARGQFLLFRLYQVWQRFDDDCHSVRTRSRLGDRCDGVGSSRGCQWFQHQGSGFSKIPWARRRISIDPNLEERKTEAHTELLVERSRNRGVLQPDVQARHKPWKIHRFGGFQSWSGARLFGKNVDYLQNISRKPDSHWKILMFLKHRVV